MNTRRCAIYIHNSVTSLRFWTPILILYLTGKGLDFQHIALIQVIGYWISLFLDVPTSIMSDRIGRKLFIILHNTFAFFGFLIFAYAQSFMMFILAEGLISIGGSFGRGIISAYLYDSITEEEDKSKIILTNSSVTSISISLSSLLGGIISKFIGYEYCFVFSGVGYLIALIISIFFFDDAKEKRKAYGFNLVSHMKKALSSIYKKNLFEVFIGTLVINSIINIIMYTYLQPLLDSYSVGIVGVGFVYLILNVLNFLLFRLLFARIKTKQNQRMIALCNISIILGLLFLGVFKNVYASILIIVGISFASYIRNNQSFIILNRHIDSNQRATFSSVANMISLLIVSFFRFTLAYFADNINIYASFIIASIITFICVILPYIYTNIFMVKDEVIINL